MASVNFADIITFTRASGGGRFNAQGQYEWLPANEPRIDYDPVTGECRGLLVEESRTNLLAQSDNPSVSPWLRNNFDVSGNTLTETSGSAFRDMYANSPGGSNTTAFTAGVAYTAVVAVRPKPGSAKRYFQLALSGNAFPANARRAKFDIETGVVTWRDSPDVIATATLIGDLCVCRITVTAVTSGTGYGIAAGLDTNPISAIAAYTGDGVSGIELLYADLQAGAFPTSHIPTTTAQVTRAADTAVVDELSPWYNASEGTFVVEFQTQRTSGFPTIFSLLGDFFVWGNPSNNNFALNGRGNTGWAVITSPPLQGPKRYAIAVDDAGVAVSVNGSAVTRAQRARLNAMTALQVSGSLCGHIRSIRYFPRRLSDTELQEITA